MEKKKKGRPGKPASKKCHHNFRLDEEANRKFLNMLRRSGCRTKTEFICKRIFSEPFEVRKIDVSARKYFTQLDNFYYQFRKVGNNFNQVVTAIHHNFDDKTASQML